MSLVSREELATVSWRVIRPFDPWHSPLCTCPFKYTVNPYTGCGHRCLYCYASSYIRDFFSPRVKERLLLDARRDLQKIPVGSVIEMSASSDPLQPLEERYRLTHRLSQEILSRGHKILYTTKAPGRLLDYRDLLERFRDRIAVAVTITTLREDIARRLEPGAPPPRERVRAVERLSEIGIPVTVRIDPIVPYINDDPDELRELVDTVAGAGALQVTTSVYKARPDSIERISREFSELGDRLYRAYYREGEFFRGYRYLSREKRLQILKLVRRYVVERGLEFATCREGFPELHTVGTVCDGSGFIRRRVDRASRAPGL